MSTDAPLSVLRELLSTSVGLTNVESRIVPQGFRSKDEVIVTHRFILLLAGAINYRLDGGVLRLEAGMRVLVPASPSSDLPPR